MSNLRLALTCVALLAPVGGGRGATYNFSNTNLIVINDSLSPPTIATPYPSAITVTGLTGQVVTKATATLNGFTHHFPSDVSVLLVGPLGQRTFLMSEAGGASGLSVTNLTITLDDSAPSYLNLTGRLASGTFKPTNGYLLLYGHPARYNFPPPVQPGSSNAVATMSVFTNTDPTGSWNLFLVDDASGSAGTISNGWSLSLTIAVPLQVTQVQTNALISWPASAANCTLQRATNIYSPYWSNLVTAALPSNGRYTYTNMLGPVPKFFRLVGP